jgi:hypothetical protein
MVENPELWKWSSYCATAGRERPHPSLTTDWVLGQFSGKRAKAEREYRQFVKWGIGEKSIMLDVKGQVILGEDELVNSLADHLKKHKHVPEIPKSQRYANRPTLEKIFEKSIAKDKKKRDGKMVEAVEKYGYRQSEIARHLGLHSSTVSNLVRNRA